ncbi:MAG: ABC transporter substrate-binding protein [Trueperaceae bacterium]
MKRIIFGFTLLMSLSLAQSYPVTIENCGETLTFDKAPERVVTMYSPQTEIMLALGLQDRIVGAASYGNEMREDLVPLFEDLNLIGADWLIPKELMLSLEPDLVISNLPEYQLDSASGFASREDLASSGTQVYVLTAKCEGQSENAKFEDIYTDLENMGKLFGVEERATDIISKMQASIADTQKRILDKEPVKVALYESGEGPLGMYGPGAWDVVLRLAGSENVFADMNEAYLELSVEEVITRDIDMFIVVDYNDGTTEQKVKFLEETLSNSDTPIVTFPYPLMNTSIQNADGVRMMAKLFYPEAFGE